MSLVLRRIAIRVWTTYEFSLRRNCDDPRDEKLHSRKLREDSNPDHQFLQTVPTLLHIFTM